MKDKNQFPIFCEWVNVGGDDFVTACGDEIFGWEQTDDTDKCPSCDGQIIYRAYTPEIHKVDEV